MEQFLYKAARLILWQVEQAVPSPENISDENLGGITHRMSCSSTKSQTFQVSLIAAGLTHNYHDLNHGVLCVASFLHSKLTFSLVLGDNARELCVVEEFKTPLILKQCTEPCGSSLHKFSKQLSCSEGCTKSVCAPISLDFICLKSDTEAKLITWAPFLVHAEK